MESLLDYLDQLEDLIDSGKTVPFSNRISVEREKIYDLISEIRLNLPDELRDAQRIIENREQLINDAKAKANNIIKESENTAKMLTNQHEIYKRATEQSTELIEDSKKRAREMRLNAMEYADEILEKTEEMVKETMVNVHKQCRIVDEYFQETINILYSNRQELRGNK